MTVHFVGAGPGAADLLTVRAVRLLESAGTVLYPGTYLDEEVLSYARDAELVDTQDLDLDQITKHLVAAHERGEDVVRLCSGDPSVYSALTEQKARLDVAGVPWDVVPGVPAYAAAAALLRAELTVPEVAQSVVLTRTQQRSTVMPEAEELERFAATGSTLVLHLSVRRTTELAERLTPYYGAACPVAVVYRASQPGQQVLIGALATIGEQVERAGLTQAALILVGPALAARTSRGSFLYDPARERRTR
ncbi:SAM-dependent methyltransferase [Luteipulveratus sp. YIM 133132]|uniref:SAM-dependent methyltransferase n=1 Tax=Luteipulveratus flavus TaxID=3031728 RepID=A0ABT6C7C5_9MICO|nr:MULTISPECIES: SAM-dependent methyltransferase [unclassified Luteipulveratus]MDE9365230.1 SAM-dependent methyltransferase [Luteipulveratus sp. YIM 133132]MDF8264433.1 SAM-dependent methyltransferase [Luteipulveratus sp. YIM 133296]